LSIGWVLLTLQSRYMLLIEKLSRHLSAIFNDDLAVISIDFVHWLSRSTYEQ